MDERASITPRRHGLQQLNRLCSVVGLSHDDAARAGVLFDVLAQTWPERPLALGPDWLSDVTGDHTPYEFSLAFDGALTEVRFLAEARASEMNPHSAWEAGCAATRRLAALLDVPLRRFEEIDDLFVPASTESRFALWHAVCLRPGESPDLKIYLDPNAHGASNARARVGEALERLGLAAAWRFVAREALRAQDTLAYLSLDLSRAQGARVKVYMVHPGIDSGEIERLVATDPASIPGAASHFCRTILGSDPPYLGRPLGTCFAFTQGGERPHSVTLHIPLVGYLESDADVVPGLHHLLDPSQQHVLAAATAAISTRSLASASGLFQWVSMRWSGGRGRMTLYVCPEAYRTFKPQETTCTAR